MKSRRPPKPDSNAYPFWIFGNVDLNIPENTANFIPQIPTGLDYYLKKILVQYPTPGTPPVFQDLELSLQTLGWNKVLSNEAIPLTMISTPGKGEVNGGFYKANTYQNAKSIDWVLMAKTTSRIIIENFTPSIAGNNIDIVLIGHAFRVDKVGK